MTLNQRWIEFGVAEFSETRQRFTLSPGDLSRLGSGERNPAEGGGPRVSHWAGVRASVNTIYSFAGRSNDPHCTIKISGLNLPIHKFRNR
jgi:hypothetical protein